MTGEELEKIANKYLEHKPLHKHNGYMYYLSQYDWDAIAKAITPEPLTMEELRGILESCHTRERPSAGYAIYLECKTGFINLLSLLDLINNKQKEQSCHQK